MKRKPLYPTKVFKRFLNRNKYHDLAGVRATIEVDGHGYLDAGLSLSDCSRTINLDFNCYDEGSFKNSLHKCDVLEQAIAFMRANLVESYEIVKTHKATKKLHSEID